jgi:hypothetical protein
MARWSRTLQSGYICLGYILPLSGAALGIVFVAINGTQECSFALLGNHPSLLLLLLLLPSPNSSVHKGSQSTSHHMRKGTIAPHAQKDNRTQPIALFLSPHTHHPITPPPPFRTQPKTLSPGFSSGSKFGPRSIPVTVGSRTVWEDGPPEYYLLSFWLFTCLQVRASSIATQSAQRATHTNTRTACSNPPSHPNALGFKRMAASRSRPHCHEYTPRSLTPPSKNPFPPSLAVPPRKLIAPCKKTRKKQKCIGP